MEMGIILSSPHVTLSREEAADAADEVAVRTRRARAELYLRYTDSSLQNDLNSLFCGARKHDIYINTVVSRLTETPL